MTTSYVVLITDEDRPDSGEVKIIQGEGEVARYVEVLLEGGFSQERIRVFRGAEVSLEVSYRPVVSLTPPAEEPAPVARPRDTSEERTEEDAVQEDQSAEAPGVRNGIRFSELFRPS